MARARPLDKFRMVKLLQELGEVVAVTGDGTNDAPALKKADVGLAMGIAGTEVAKEASKIVLLDDSFATIVKAVHWGRSLYENIQRFIQFQLTINVSALAIAFLGPFFGVKPPFTVLQLLWINVIMDTFASIALCSEPPRPGVMRLPPKKRDESILTPAMLRTIVTTAVFFVVVMMALLCGMEYGRLVCGHLAEVGRLPGTDGTAGQHLLHRLRPVPGVERNQLPLAGAGGKRPARLVLEPDLPGDRGGNRGGSGGHHHVRRRGVQGGAVERAGVAGHRCLHGVGAGVRRSGAPDSPGHEVILAVCGPP